MKLTLKVTRDTTDSELIHLGNFFTALGLNRGAKVFAAPTDAAELDEPEGDVVHIPATPEQEAAIDAATGITPKRRRRTKAEIEADALAAENARVAAAEAEAQASNEAGLKAIEEQEQGIAPGEAGNEQPAATHTAPVTDGAEKETAASTPATASPSDGKTYTHAEVQAMAVDTARRYGPEKVKAIIATYPNAAKIAELADADLAGFVVKLQALTA